MNFSKSKFLFLILLGIACLGSCKQSTQWKGQEPIKKVSTTTVPIQLQYKGTFDLGDGIFMSNEFEGARLNGVARTNDSLITALITAENSPINSSPWYAFKIWSEAESKIYLKLTYPEGDAHRYFPKLSSDGLNWQPLDSSNYYPSEKYADEELQLFENMTMRLSIGTDTLWIAAQELENISVLESWLSKLESNAFVSKTIIGESREGRPIYSLKIGNSDDQKMIMVLSRQHPPEVTGYLGMKAFVEAICSDNEIAENFRNNYNTYVVPMVNPDGVYHGNWRHNQGGIDLNRDWEDFNQIESSLIRDFMKTKLKIADGKFYFAIDFHSTWKDIYYTISPELKGNMPGLVPDVIAAAAKELGAYEPNVKPRTAVDAKVSTLPYFFYEFGAEALTYEIGDNTPREFVRKKGEVTAMKLMELMLERTNTSTK